MVDFHLDYNLLERRQISLSALWAWHLERIIGAMRRKISFREKIKDPWKIKVEEFIHRDVFVQWYRVLRDFRTEHGRTLDKTEKQYTISFHHLGTFMYHLKQLSGKENVIAFSKKVKTGSTASVIATAAQPVKITYNISKSTLLFELHYQVINKYGNVM